MHSFSEIVYWLPFIKPIVTTFITMPKSGIFQYFYFISYSFDIVDLSKATRNKLPHLGPTTKYFVMKCFDNVILYLNFLSSFSLKKLPFFSFCTLGSLLRGKYVVTCAAFYNFHSIRSINLKKIMIFKFLFMNSQANNKFEELTRY